MLWTYPVHSCSILSADFMRTSIHDAGNMDVAIVSRAKASLPMNGEVDEVRVVTRVFVLCSLGPDTHTHTCSNVQFSQVILE